MTEQSGVVFPEVDGRRSTSALGRAVVEEALRTVDPVGAAAAARETTWRQGYADHFRRMVEAGLGDEGDAVAIARAGLGSLHERMQVTSADATVSLRSAFSDDTSRDTSSGASGVAALASATVRGRGTPHRELSIPVAGQRLSGDSLRRKLDDWQARGIIEPSAAEAVVEVMHHPEWLSLPDHRVVVLGAGTEMGPLRALLSWGADLVGVDLPRPEVWNRVLGTVRDSAGSLTLPVPAGTSTEPDGGLAGRAGADLLHDLHAVTDWVGGHDGRLVLGNYVYADGATNVRVACAVDALSVELVRRRPGEVGLAFLATPTDVFGVPADAVSQSVEAYRSASGRAPALVRFARPALRTVTGGRLLRRNYAPGADPGVVDSVVPQQGPNYLLAKRLQRWRATVARRDGIPVSMRVAPPTRTRSVVKNRALAAAYAGAGPFGIEVFEPATSNVLMAALLVHDLHRDPPAPTDPWREEADGAVHGGLWRGPYDPRSALGIAVVLGLGAARP